MSRNSASHREKDSPQSFRRASWDQPTRLALDFSGVTTLLSATSSVAVIAGALSAPRGTRIPHSKSGKLTAMSMTKTGDCGNTNASRNAAAKCPMNTRPHRRPVYFLSYSPVHHSSRLQKSKALWAIVAAAHRVFYPGWAVAPFHLREDPEQEEIRAINRHVSFRDKDVLEIGCGDARRSLCNAREAFLIVPR